MNRYLSVLASIFFVCTLIGIGFSFSGNGSGTVADPYNITNCNLLNETRLNLTAHYQLTQDVNCSDTVNWNSGSGFDPIGRLDNEFNGTFKGNGYSVNGLYINRSSEEYVGLFGATGSEANITGIRLENVIVVGSHQTGGLAGYNYGYSITNASVTGFVTGNQNVGGLVGRNRDKIHNSFANVIVNGSDDVGGLAGENDGGNISGSYSTGSVEGSDNVGGLVGYNTDAPSVSNSYATGFVNGSTNIGGLIGSGGSGCSNSFWDVNTTGQDSSNGGCSADGNKTTSQMKNKLMFTDTGWDFTDSWTIWGSYPKLQWAQNVSCTNINQSGFYDLNNNVSDTRAGEEHCMMISSDDIVFNGKGHSIKGSPTEKAIVHPDNFGPWVNITVKNTIIDSYDFGIASAEYKDSLILNNTFKNNNRSLYSKHMANYTDVINNTFINSTSGALRFSGDVYNSDIMNNQFYNNSETIIHLEGGKTVNVSLNNIQNSFDTDWTTVSFHSIENLSVTHNKLVEVSKLAAYGSPQSSLEFNNISGTGKLEIIDSQGSTLRNNTLNGTFGGISIGYGNNYRVINNTVTNESLTAMSLVNASNNTVRGNSLDSSHHSVLELKRGSKYNMIINNTLEAYNSTGMTNVKDIAADNWNQKKILDNTGTKGRPIKYLNSTSTLNSGNYSQVILYQADNSQLSNITFPSNLTQTRLVLSNSDGVTVANSSIPGFASFSSSNVGVNNVSIGSSPRGGGYSSTTSFDYEGDISVTSISQPVGFLTTMLQSFEVLTSAQSITNPIMVDKPRRPIGKLQGEIQIQMNISYSSNDVSYMDNSTLEPMGFSLEGQPSELAIGGPKGVETTGKYFYGNITQPMVFTASGNTTLIVDTIAKDNVIAENETQTDITMKGCGLADTGLLNISVVPLQAGPPSIYNTTQNYSEFTGNNATNVTLDLTGKEDDLYVVTVEATINQTDLKRRFMPIVLKFTKNMSNITSGLLIDNRTTQLKNYKNWSMVNNINFTTQYGKIEFQGPNLVKDIFSVFGVGALNESFNMQSIQAEMDSRRSPGFNTTSQITLYNYTEQNISNPEIYVDGEKCPASVCHDVNASYNATYSQDSEYDIKFTAEHWSTYEVKENSPPGITNVTADSGSENTATITWITDENATSKIEYGTSESLGTTKSSSNLMEDHSIELTDLSPDTTYNYNVTSCDDDENCSTEGTYSFTTSSSSDDGGSSGGSDGAVEEKTTEEYNTGDETINNTRKGLSDAVKQEIESVIGTNLTEAEWEETVNKSTEFKKNRYMQRMIKRMSDSMNATLTVEINESTEDLLIIDNTTKNFAENASNIDLDINPQPDQVKWIEEDPVLLIYYKSINENITAKYITNNTNSNFEAWNMPEPELYVLGTLNITCQRTGCPEGEICKQVDGEYTCVKGNKKPIAKFTATKAETTINTTITFNASESSDPDGSIESYEWSFGDGETATGKTVEHEYSEQGNYTVTLTITDNENATSQAQKHIEIKSERPKKIAGVNWALIIAVIVILAAVVAVIFYYEEREEDYPIERND